MIHGTATLHMDPKEALYYARGAAKQPGVSESELYTEPQRDAVYIRVVPERLRSWDYSTDS